MDLTSVVVGQNPDANSYGPTFQLTRLGDTSPKSSGQVQYVAQGNQNFLQTFTTAAKRLVTLTTGIGPATAVTASKGANALGQGVLAAGNGIKAVATSVSSGIKWGIIIVIVGLGLWFIAPTLSLFRPRGR